MKNYTIAVLGSHSALDVCRGAKDLGFKTLVIVKDKRDQTYAKYYKSRGNLGCVDEVLYVDEYKDLLKPEIQKILKDKNCIFIPHRSFEVYVKDYDAIENDFKIPMFGNRFLLRTEERGSKNGVDQYKIMDEAGIRYPKQFKNPSEIDRLVIVKVLEKERGFERSFFLAKDKTEYNRRSRIRIKRGDFLEEHLQKAVIEEFVPGVQVNFNFFYDPLNQRLELLGTDTRRQTNRESMERLSDKYQQLFLNNGSVKFEEAGHIAVTVLESLLEPAFEIGEKFVEATKKLGLPVIGPFGLQTMIIPGPPKKEIIVFDVSPRMPGSPGIFATPYSGYLYGQNISMGKRVAMEIKQAIEEGKLERVLT